MNNIEMKENMLRKLDMKIFEKKLKNKVYGESINVYHMGELKNISMQIKMCNSEEGLADLNVKLQPLLIDKLKKKSVQSQASVSTDVEGVAQEVTGEKNE